MTTSGPFDFANYRRTFGDRAAESNDSEMQARNLSDLLDKVSKNSASEIDNLIGEFQRVRESSRPIKSAGHANDEGHLGKRGEISNRSSINRIADQRTVGRSVSSPFSLLLRFPILRLAAESDLFELANDFSSLSQPIPFGQRRLSRIRRERSIFLFDCAKVLLIGPNGFDFTFRGSGHGVQLFDGPGRLLPRLMLSAPSKIIRTSLQPIIRLVLDHQNAVLSENSIRSELA